jgi:hypothetical protein
MVPEDHRAKIRPPLGPKDIMSPRILREGKDS